MTQCVCNARGEPVWTLYEYCPSVQVYVVYGDTPRPPPFGYGVCRRITVSVNSPNFKVKKYEVDHSRQLIRDKDNHQVMSF